MDCLSSASINVESEKLNVASSNIYRVNINNLTCSEDSLLSVTRSTEFLYVDANPKLYRRIYFYDPGFLCLLYSTVDINWQHGDNNGVLKRGEVIVFNCNVTLSYMLERTGDVFVVLIPTGFYDVGIVNLMTGRGCFVYFNFIVSIIESVNSDDSCLLLKYKIVAIINLLSVVIEIPVINSVLSQFERMKQIIHANALDPEFSLTKASALFFCSKRKLQKCLLEQGTSYSKLIHEYRINYISEQLLVNKTAKIDSLCYESGFNSPSYAISKFKSIKGMTPMRYRIAYREASTIK